MTRSQVIIKNITSNFAGYSVSLITGLLLSPFVVHSLGDTYYGLWTLIQSLTGYYGLLDLGIFSGVSQYVTRYMAKGDKDGVNRIMTTALFILVFVTVFALLVTFSLVLVLPKWFGVEGEEGINLQWAMALMGIGIAINLPMSVFKAIPYGLQKLEILNLVIVVNRLIEVGLTIWLLKEGYGILGVAGAALAAHFIGWIIQAYFAFSICPSLSIKANNYSKNAFKEIWGYGFFSVIITAAEKVTIHANTLIVGFFLTAEAVTYYAIGANLVPYYMAIIQTITWTFTPYATSRDAHGDESSLQRLLLSGTRGTVALAAFMGSGLILLGNDFLGLWMGDKYVSGDIFVSSGTILSLLTLATFIRLTQSCGFQVLFGMRKVKFLSLLAIIELLSNIILSIVFIKNWGLIGIPFSMLLTVFFIRGVLQPIYLLRTIKVEMRKYLLQVFIGFCPIVLTMGIFNWATCNMLPISTWLDLIARGAIISIPGALIGYFAVISRHDRRALFSMYWKK